MISKQVMSASKVFLKSTIRNITCQYGRKYSKIAMLTVSGAKKVMTEKLDDYTSVWDDMASKLTLMVNRALDPKVCLSTLGCDVVNSNVRYFSMRQQAEDIQAAEKSQAQDGLRAEESVSAAGEAETGASSDWDDDDTPVVEAILPEGSIGSICSNLAREEQMGISVDDELPGSETANYMTFNPFSPHVRELADDVQAQENYE